MVGTANTRMSAHTPKRAAAPRGAAAGGAAQRVHDGGVAVHVDERQWNDAAAVHVHLEDGARQLAQKVREGASSAARSRTGASGAARG